MRYSTISFAVLLASTTLFANAATLPDNITGDVVINSENFPKPDAKDYNVNYYLIDDGNTHNVIGKGSRLWKLDSSQ